MSARNVLVFPASSEIGLEIHEALRQCKEVRLFGAGVAGTGHGEFAFDKFFHIPSIEDPRWLEALIYLCRDQAIDYIFPAYDDVVVALAKEREKLGAVVLTCSLDTCLIARSKRLTYRVLQEWVKVPQVYEGNPEKGCYPVIVKPDRGQGSQDVTLVHNKEQLLSAVEAVDDPIVCEYLPGEEYTVDCFSDREHGVLFAKARKRNRVRTGIAVNTSTVELQGVEKIAQKIHDALHMYGAWFFQLKCTTVGALALLEVAPRIAGSMSLHRVLGVNFPLLSIFEHERRPINILVNRDVIKLDRALRNRYRHSITFSTLYIDLDDSIILNDQVNIDAISLIFKCINQGVKVKLLTRHANDLSKTLAHYRLSNIFDEIIHINDAERKSNYIVEPDSIFIDDSFSERRQVAQNREVRTYDCSMIELLLQSNKPLHNSTE